MEVNDRYIFTLEFVEEIAVFLKSFRNENILKIEKKGEINLVTEADKGAEEKILKNIKSKFPQDPILCEETGIIASQGQLKWIIDPLDGTTNYAHGLPLYGIAIALEDITTSQILMGVVALPDLGDVYHAKRGNGAFKNNKPIHVSHTNQLINALCCTGFPYNQESIIDDIMFRLQQIMLLSRGVRRTGAATLDLCWLAQGMFDGFWEDFLQPWDMAAPSIIIEEAGGKVSAYNGDCFTPYVKNIVASNSILHETLVQSLKIKS